MAKKRPQSKGGGTQQKKQKKAPTGQPQLALALELSMGEVLAMLKDKASFVNPLQVSIIYFRAQGTKLPGL